MCRADFPDRLNVLQQIQATNRQASSIDATPGELFPAGSEEAALQRCVHTSCNIQARFLAPKPALPAFGQIKPRNALQTPARLPSLLQNNDREALQPPLHPCLPARNLHTGQCLPLLSGNVSACHVLWQQVSTPRSLGSPAWPLSACRWAVEQGLLSRLTPARFDGLRGLTPEADLEAGDTALSLPEGLLISESTARASDLVSGLLVQCFPNLGR